MSAARRSRRSCQAASGHRRSDPCRISAKRDDPGHCQGQFRAACSPMAGSNSRRRCDPQGEYRQAPGDAARASILPTFPIPTSSTARWRCRRTNSRKQAMPSRSATRWCSIRNNGFRNTPYVVNQLGSSYVDLPDFLESRHVIANADDARGLCRPRRRLCPQHRWRDRTAEARPRNRRRRARLHSRQDDLDHRRRRGRKGRIKSAVLATFRKKMGDGAHDRRQTDRQRVASRWPRKSSRRFSASWRS